MYTCAASPSSTPEMHEKALCRKSMLLLKPNTFVLVLFCCCFIGVSLFFLNNGVGVDNACNCSLQQME